jgi:hypothetical protein
LCVNHLEKGDNYQTFTILIIALIIMFEELGLDMAIQSLELLSHTTKSESFKSLSSCHMLGVLLMKDV